MGLHDREYVREEARRPRSWLGEADAVWLLIGANVVCFILNLASEGNLFELIALPADAPLHPSQWWKLVAHGFAHSDAYHILFNMLGLWFFGRAVEDRYRRAEFLRVYFVTIFIAGLGFCGLELLRKTPFSSAVGASGGVSGVMILYALNFPRNKIWIYGLFPVNAIVLVTIYVAIDVLGMTHPGHDHVAHSAHLAGAAFAAAYFYFDWNLGALVPTALVRRLQLFRRKLQGVPLRAHRPRDGYEDLSERADALLDKITREGIDSLTAKEKALLEEHSRRVQERRGR